MDELASTAVVIARHGNTFDPGDVILRCGARTDLPLSSSGRCQAQALGDALAHEYPGGFDAVHVSTLQRTQETARLALGVYGRSHVLIVDSFFDEIDYGPDEGRPESEVLTRLGAHALTAWDEAAVVPPGWQCDPRSLVQGWRRFLDQVVANRHRRTLIVTSNGIARFALRNVKDFAAGGKLSTGAYGVLAHGADGWNVQRWNVRPVVA